MRKIINLTIILLTVIVIKAQVPVNFNYQGVVRNSSGELLINSDINIKISILEESTSGLAVFEETHLTQTNSYGQFNIIIGAGNNPSGDISGLNWTTKQYFIKTEIDESGGSNFTELGTVQLMAVPYAVVANSAIKLGDSEVYGTSSDTLFVVKDHDGKVVFAVFPDGAEIIVNKEAKGKVGGFAVSGRNPSKAEDEVYLTVTADSTRIIVNQPANKGKVGGFAVSGRNPSKSLEEDYLLVTSDSTRIYINDTTSKGKVGGFAVSGRNPSKDAINPFVLLTPENYFIGHQSGAANVTGLYNSFYGYQTGMGNQGGSRNIFIGYKTGSLNGDGNENVFIGNSAGYNNEFGNQNIFLGHYAGFSNQTGYYNIFIGDSAGYNNNPFDASLGFNNIYIGQRSGLNNTGRNNIFMGTQAGYESDTVRDCIFIGWESGFNNQGNNNIFLGNKAGAGWSEAEVFTASNNVFIGNSAGTFNQTGDYNVCLGTDAGSELFIGNENVIIGSFSGIANRNGDKNVFIGPYSGFSNENGDLNIYIGYKAGYYEDISNRLIVENSDTTSEGALIYGEFDNDIVQINSRLGIGIYPSDTANASLVVKGNIRVADGIFLDDGVIVSDYVFENSYKLITIKEHNDFMWQHKHLPKVDSKEKIINEGGVDMSARREQILEELELAHIYIYELYTETKVLESENEELKIRIEKLEKLVNTLIE